MKADSCPFVEPKETWVIHVRDLAAHPGAVYVGREHSGRGHGPSFRRSKWANPWKAATVGRVRAVNLYALWIAGDPDADAMLPPGRWHRPTLNEVRRELVDRVLVCWCSPHLCHADVLAALANGLPVIASGFMPRTADKNAQPNVADAATSNRTPAAAGATGFFRKERT